MKFKYSIIAGLCGLAMVSTACSDDKGDYTAAAPVNTPEVYFSRLDATVYSLVETDTEIKVPVYRLSDGAEATVAIEVVNPDANIFTVDKTVTFAEGEQTAEATIYVDPLKMEGAKPYELTLKVGNGENTPYFLTSVTYTLTFLPWTDFVDEKGNNMAQYTDDFVTTWFGVDNLTYDVPMQYCEYMPGVYRLVNPYGEYYPYNEPGDYDEGNHYMYFNISNPKQVFLCNARGDAYDGSGMAVFNTGMDWSYGEFIFSGIYNLRMYQASLPANEANKADLIAEAEANAGSYVKGVVTFPAEALLCRMDNYTKPGSWSIGNTNGLFKIVFPGVDENDLYDWEEAGTGQWTDGIVFPYYGEPAQTYDVQVQYFSDGEQTLYRVMNPYKYGVFPGEDGMKYDDNAYIIIDASNPDCVKVPIQKIGWVDSDNGAMSVINAAAFFAMQDPNITDETIISQGYNDAIVDNVLTFNEGMLMYVFQESPNAAIKNQLYDCATTKLALPDAAALAKKAAKKHSVKSRHQAAFKSNVKTISL